MKYLIITLSLLNSLCYAYPVITEEYNHDWYIYLKDKQSLGKIYYKQNDLSPFTIIIYGKSLQDVMNMIKEVQKKLEEKANKDKS